MAELSRDQFFERIRERIGDSTSDADIQFMEDITDTYNKLEQNGQEDWKKKYEENDKQWRTKYRDRFFSAVKDDDDEPKQQEEEQKLTYDSLFKKGGK